MTLTKRSSSKRCPDNVKQAHLAQLQQYRPNKFTSMVRTDESWPSNRTEVAGAELSATGVLIQVLVASFHVPQEALVALNGAAGLGTPVHCLQQDLL